MIDTRKMIIPISVVASAGVIISFLNRNKLAKLNERVDDTKEDVKSINSIIRKKRKEYLCYGGVFKTEKANSKR